MYTAGPIQILARPGGIPTVIVDTAAVILLPGNMADVHFISIGDSIFERAAAHYVGKRKGLNLTIHVITATTNCIL